MATDILYTLNEVFDLAASSQNQFLNLLDAKLTDCIAKINRRDYEVLTNLMYIKDILHNQIQYVNRTLASIQNARHRKWPVATGDLGDRATTAKEAVIEDYKHIAKIAESLHARCIDSISTLMSSASIAEAKTAIQQQERVGKLTFLAFMFVPMSFTTSFFSMNAPEVQNLSIWTWFVLTSSILFVSLLFYRGHIQALFRWFRDRLFELL